MNDTDVRQQRWLRLQLNYIKATTQNYKHVICLTGHGGAFSKTHTEVIHVPARTKRTGPNRAHVVGLNGLAEYFRERTGEFDCYVILDSDAFPIRRHWASMLMRQLRKYNKEIAIARRFECLENRAHSSILFALPEALPHLRFEVAPIGYDLLSKGEGDCCLIEYEGDRKSAVFPLLRSNQYDVDPIFCGVYYDLFYHHGCGSRRKKSRGLNYWSHVGYRGYNHMEELFREPTAFISKLAGWTPRYYVKVDGVIEPATPKESESS